MLSTAPRYYVMILPFLLLGVSPDRSASSAKELGGGWCDLVLLAGLLFFVVMNIAKIVPFVIEQQRVPFYEAGMRYYDTYRGGKFAPVIHLADLVREKVPTGAKVITPSAQIVRYLSDRDVLMERELFPPRKSPRHYPEHLASMQIAYAAFPAKIYLDKEPTHRQADQARRDRAGQAHRIGGWNPPGAGDVQVRPGDWQKLRATDHQTDDEENEADDPSHQDREASRRCKEACGSESRQASQRKEARSDPTGDK